MKILRQSIGVDISKSKFDCCLGVIDELSNFKILGHKTFANNPSGFLKLIHWIESKKIKSVPISLVMEATGVYYENLAYYLNDNSTFDISVVLPAKAKFYFKSLSHKSKTDKADAEMLCQFSLERRLRIWKPISCNLREMKILTREHRDNKKMLNQLKNQLHAKLSSYKPIQDTIKRLKKKIELIEIQCLQIENELKSMTHDNDFISDKLDKVCSIPGVGFMTAISVVSEMNGFALVKNAKQLTSYAGLDVRHNDSGMKTGKSRISKKGNRYIRAALYMPALSASRLNEHLKDFYSRINSKNKCKKIGLIGVARKLLILIYTLYKNDEYFKLAS